MGKKITPAEMALLNAIESKPAEKNTLKIAGAESVHKAKIQISSEKKHTVALKLTDSENDKVTKVAQQISKYGVQISKGNAIRLALELLAPSDEEIKVFADRISQSDKRKQR